MKHYLRHYCCWRISLSLCFFSCSVEESNRYQDMDTSSLDSTASQTVITKENIDQVTLMKSEDELIVKTFALGFGSSAGLNLNTSSESWTTTLEESVSVSTSIEAETYLNVISQLKMSSSKSEMTDMGCIYVELRDNTSYEHQTLLRISTTGVKGEDYPELTAPLYVKRDQWRDVPVLQGSLTLSIFEANTIKKFNGELCFKMDLSNMPAQVYSGQIIVQYLVAEGDSRDYDDDAPEQSQSFTCGEEPKILRAKQKARLSFKDLVDPSQYFAKISNADDTEDFGSLTMEDGELFYQAPASVPSAKTVFITATPYYDDLLPEYCQINLMDDDSFFEEDDGVSQALVGNVYQLPNNTQNLPDFDAMQAIATIMVPNFDVPERRFDEGFPGVNDLIEWFGIRFYGQIYVPEDCDCRFRLTADDGAILYIDGYEVINNDGLHPTRSRTDEFFLTAGLHDFKIDYFQGPRYHITLQLLWDNTDDGSFQVIDPMYFYR